MENKEDNEWRRRKTTSGEEGSQRMEKKVETNGEEGRQRVEKKEDN